MSLRSLSKMSQEEIELAIKEHLVIRCLECNKLHLKKSKRKNGKYCSNRCTYLNATKNKLYVEKRICGFCHNVYEASKYKKTKGCSMRCAALLRYNRPVSQDS